MLLSPSVCWLYRKQAHRRDKVLAEWKLEVFAGAVCFFCMHRLFGRTTKDFFPVICITLASPTIVLPTPARAPGVTFETGLVLWVTGFCCTAFVAAAIACFLLRCWYLLYFLTCCTAGFDVCPQPSCSLQKTQGKLIMFESKRSNNFQSC